MFGLGIPVAGLLTLVLLGFVIATTVNTFAMEAAVLFVPAFLFVFPLVVPGFPTLETNAAVGLALFVELFGYSSSVTAYWYRHQIDFHIAGRMLALTIPLAALARVGSYFAPSGLLMLGFGVLLLLLSIVLFESHEHGPSLVDTVMEKPEMSFLAAVLEEEYEPRTRVLDGGHEAAETPPAESMGGAASSEAAKGTGTAVVGDSDDGRDFHLEPFDMGMTAAGGVLAGLVGIAIGELTQTMLALRRRVPLRLSTGTAAFVLHATIVAALLSNIAVLQLLPSVAGAGFSVPFGIGLFVATGCLFGGQMGAYLNNRLSEERVMQMLITVYFLVGCLVTVRTVLLGTAH
ncbi:MAG: TSUP family transporter [Halodesulfurarchaeum sp.]